MVDYNVTWQDPPPTASGRHSNAAIDAIVAKLKGNPGKWALIRVINNPGSSYKPLRDRGVETTVRRRLDNRYDLYARWPKTTP
jgi:hypothetical protein